jgi:hypothetical protein
MYISFYVLVAMLIAIHLVDSVAATRRPFEPAQAAPKPAIRFFINSVNACGRHTYGKNWLCFEIPGFPQIPNPTRGTAS